VKSGVPGSNAFRLGDHRPGDPAVTKWGVRAMPAFLLASDRLPSSSAVIAVLDSSTNRTDFPPEAA
jgi:hypothetical protein